MIIHIDLSKRIYHFRTDNSLTQKEMSELCNISLRHYQDLEAGRAAPNFKNTMYISKALNISLDSLRNDIRLNDNSEFILKRLREGKNSDILQ